MTEKNALITGGARRIGRAITLALAEAGWNLAIHYHRSQNEAEDTAHRVEKLGRRAVLFKADLLDEDETEKLVERATKNLGPLSLLVNNASLFYMDKLNTMSRTSWNDHIGTNLRAPLILSQYFANQIPEHGNIVNMLDQRVVKPTPYFLSYTIAKTGLWTATKMLALALAPKIRVNAIGPGPTLPSPRQSESEFMAHCKALPLGGGSSPDEIAQALLFILNCPSMTGQILALDGGEHLGWQVPGRGYQPKE